MKWFELTEDTLLVPGQQYLISGYIENTPGEKRWYTVAVFEEDCWFEVVTGEETYHPTHYIVFEELP